MLEGIEYTLCWGAYLLAAGGLLTVWWRMIKLIPWHFPRQFLRIVLAVVLLAPAPASQGSSEWAPAIFVLLFDLTLVDGTDPLRAVSYVLYGVILGFMALVIDIIIRRQPGKPD